MIHSADRRRFLWRLTLVVGAIVEVIREAGAQPAPSLRKTPSGDLLETVAKGELPSFAKKGSPKLAEGYRDAAANGETLQYIPCFCGCKNIGHRSNVDCYVTERHADGRITFNSHAAT